MYYKGGRDNNTKNLQPAQLGYVGSEIKSNWLKHWPNFLVC